MIHRRTTPQRSICRNTRAGFTLVELLVVIAIIAILASILFPVFATAREKGRQAVCASNLKQFMLGIMMYTSDNNDKMPLSVSGNAQVGPVCAANNNIQEFGVHTEIMPYIKSRGLFQCPDDNGFVTGATPKCGQTYTSNGDTVSDVYGTSYKFTKENFSEFPSTASTATVGNFNCFNCTAKNSNPTDRLISLADPPFPMPIAYFQRPAETRVMRCFMGPWEALAVGKPAVFHPDGMMMSFMDGHVKWVKNQVQYDSYCDGPTFSPIRNSDQPGYSASTKNGDGSCGGERIS